jgi:hypothetical protein
MRLTEFANPKTYALTAEDAGNFMGGHYHDRPNDATDVRPPSPQRAKTLPPLSPTKFFDKL